MVKRPRRKWHAQSANALACSAPTGSDLSAPLTLHDAFSDLPSIRSTTREFHKNEANTAPKETTDAPHRATKYTGLNSAGNPVKPLCSYQANARAGCKGDELHDHESFVLNEDDDERVKSLPLVPIDPKRARDGARVCWKDLPEDKKIKSGRPMVPDYARTYRRQDSCFGRLKWSDIVPTVVCRPEPHNRPIVHPDEARILSIRENARIQGFPDWFAFSGSIYARYRQV